MRVPNIEFRTQRDVLAVIPSVQPASKFVPGWYRRLDRETSSARGTVLPIPTVKKCVPFADALMAGYVVPVPRGFHAWASDGEVRIQVEGGTTMPMFDNHASEQVAGWPFGKHAFKMISPWLMKLPPGYSALVLPPLNRVECPLVPVAGLVDFDTYEEFVNFPCWWDHARFPEFDGWIDAGTPFAQIIPFKRESWEFSLGEITEEDSERRLHVLRMLANYRGTYRKFFHHRKRWS